MDAKQAFASLFRGYDQRHGRFEITGSKTSGKIEGRALTVDQPPTLATYEEHLEGRAGIGVIPLTEDNRCYFAAIDVDKYDLDHREIAERVKGLPLIVTESKSGGVHLWLFIKGGAPAPLVVKVIKTWAGQLGFGGCEIFPKQTERASPTDVGNWINLPYFGQARRCVTQTGDRLDLDGFLALAYGDDETPGRRVSAQWLEDVGAKVERVGPKVKGELLEDFTDGPPCFQTMLEQGLQEGTRNDSFFAFAVYLLRKYEDPDMVKRKLYELDQKMSIGLSNREIDMLVKSATKKDYGYKCNQSPLKDYCQRGICVKRQFGVGGRRGETDFKVEIGGMTKILTEPEPMWALNINGKRVLLTSTKQLINQNLFKEVVINATSAVVPALPQERWDAMVQSWLNQADEVEVPHDMTPQALMLSAIRAFIDERRATSRDRIISGNAWIDQGLVYFRPADLKNFFTTNKIDIDHRQLTLTLKEKYGLSFVETSIGSTSVRLWSLPAKYFEIVDEALEQPKQDTPF